MGDEESPESDYNTFDKNESSENVENVSGHENGALPFARMMREARPEAGLISLGILFLLCNSLTSLAVPVFFGRVIDAITSSTLKNPIPELRQACLELLGIAAVGALTSFANSLLFGVAGERIVRRVRTSLFNSLLFQETAFFDMSMTGELVNRLSSDCTKLSDALTSSIGLLLRWSATIIGGLIYMFVISWKLTGVILLMVPAIGIGARTFGVYVRRMGRLSQDALASATETATEALQHIRTVKAFVQEGAQQIRYGDRIDEAYGLGVKVAFGYSVFRGALSLIASTALVGLLFLGGKWTHEGELTPGQLSSFVIYAIQIGSAFAGIASIFASFSQAAGASEKVFALMDRKGELWTRNGQHQPAESGGQLVFDNVQFTYPSRTTPALNGFSLSIERGSIVALVGSSGAGKSTVAALSLRFYDPNSGAVLLDGVNLAAYDLGALRRSIAIVAQEPVLFAASIRENIAYGRPSATDHEIEDAARRAHAHEFVSGFEDGYNTRAGERGVRLSGGQRQRIAIARAILANPRVLVLDEATSALDAESEHIVQAALEELMQGRTVLIIAHRLSTVRNADKVVVVEEGRAIAEGTHGSLQTSSEVYQRLVQHQLMA